MHKVHQSLLSPVLESIKRRTRTKAATPPRSTPTKQSPAKQSPSSFKRSSTFGVEINHIDEKHRHCPLCARHFTVFRTRHECRNCLRKVCNVCSKNKMKISNENKNKNGGKHQRVCDPCAKTMFTEAAAFRKSSRTRKVPRENNARMFENTSMAGRNRAAFSVLLFCVVLRYLFGHPRYNEDIGTILHWWTLPYSGMLMSIVQQIASLRGGACYLLVIFLLDEIMSAWTGRKKDTVAVIEEGKLKPLPSKRTTKTPPLSTNPPTFSAFDFAALLQETSSNSPEVHLSEYLACCRQLAAFMALLSPATGVAASKITSYIGTIETKVNNWPPHPSYVPKSSEDVEDFDNVAIYTVREAILHEVELGIAGTGGKKNPGVSRCILRLLWLLEFVEVWVRYCYTENPVERCAEKAQQAYKDTLGTRHGYVMKTAIVGALHTVPDKTKFILMINLVQDGKSLTFEERMVLLNTIQKSLRSIKDDIHLDLENEDLLNIK